MNTIGEILGKDRAGNLVGVEVEVEGLRIPGGEELAGSNWKVTADGSLRNESGEYVMRRPNSPDEALQDVKDLYRIFEKTTTRVEESVRCGVHVHINVCDLTILQLYNFITLTMVFEPLLAKYCGEHRVGNLFCLRSIDAQAIKILLEHVAKTHRLQDFRTDDVRYGFFNVKAIPEHGSLEFRAMRTTKEPKPILTWMRMLSKMKEFARGLESPVQVVEGTSGIGMLEYVEHVFGDLAEHLDVGDKLDLMLDGVRNAQDLAYSIDWHVEPEPFNESPFEATWNQIQVRRSGPPAMKFCEDAPDKDPYRRPSYAEFVFEHAALKMPKQNIRVEPVKPREDRIRARWAEVNRE